MMTLNKNLKCIKYLEETPYANFIEKYLKQ